MKLRFSNGAHFGPDTLEFGEQIGDGFRETSRRFMSWRVPSKRSFLILSNSRSVQIFLRGPTVL
jgi:hypothetical protein